MPMSVPKTLCGALPRTGPRCATISPSRSLISPRQISRPLHRGSIKHMSSSASRNSSMIVKSLPAYFMRGGTSNGIVLHRRDLPDDPADWQPILSSAMGSPDPYGRQLNGMGSGISSTSKVCVIAASARPDADVDFTFVQVGIRTGALDFASNCGNMTTAVGPFAVSERLPHRIDENPSSDDPGRRATVRIFNTNTSKIIHASFPVNRHGVYDPFGAYGVQGVPGTGARITMSFLDPAGAKTGRALPTGHAVDVLELEGDGERVEASLVDVANPGVFVRAADVGVPGDVMPATLEADAALMARLERIRRAGAARMGMDPDTQSVPKIVLVSPPPPPPEDGGGAHIVARALSMQQPHRAIPLTLALNLGTACRMAGTIPAETAVMAPGQESITLAHAGGSMDVGSVIDENGRIESALLHHTARVLMKGDVFYTTTTETK